MVDPETQKKAEPAPVATGGANGAESRSTAVSMTDVEAQADGNEKEISDPNIVDWDGPDDPAKPLNWALAKKALNFGIIVYYTFLSPLASTMTSSSAQAIMEDFGSNNENLEAFITSVFILGYAFGPIIIAPLSELYGRVIIYQSSGLLFLIFNVACAVANSLGSLIAYRFLAGVVASCPLTIGGGSIADLFRKEKRGTAMSAWLIGPIFGPALGPLICAFLTQAKGWRWNFWLVAILTAPILLVGMTLSETNATVLLQRKTIRLRKERGNNNLRSALEGQKKSPGALFRGAIIRPVKILFLSPIVFLLSLYLAVVYAYLYLSFTTFGAVFQGIYGFSLGISGLVYIGLGIGCLIGTLWCGPFSDWLLHRLAAKNNGVTKPEYRLPILLIASVLVPVGLFWYAWTAAYKTHWIVPIIGTGIFGAGVQISLTAVSIYMIDAFTIHAASAMAASSVMRSLFGSLLPLAGNNMVSSLGVGWANSVLGFIAVALIPIPVLFLVYGERLRTKYPVQL